jgi:putative transposase
MNNHVHLLLESPLGARSMSSFMHRLNQTHAMYFNGKYNRVGHLWQNRYKNVVVTKDDYLVNLMSYIEFNPVRAGIVSKPEYYLWSSYKARVMGEKDVVLDRLKGI